MKKEDKAFYQGVAVAMFGLVHGHGLPSVAQDTLKNLGISRKILESADVPIEDLQVIYEDHINDL